MVMKRIALYHLETLLWINRLGSFAAAADRLNTTQPGVSARVRELETQLGVRIFRKEGRRMVLTVHGRQLVEDCEPHWSALERALLDIGGGSLQRGIVRIGTGEIVAASCLPAFLNAQKSRLPGVSLEVSVDLSARLLEQLLAATSDVVFLAGPVASPDIRSRAIGSVGLVWAASPGVAARMLADPAQTPPIWSLPRHSPLYRVMLASRAREGLAGVPVNTCNNVRALMDIVAADGGIALLPVSMAGPWLKAGTMVEVLARPAERITFEAAIRLRETDPLVLAIFEQTASLVLGEG
jgi:DNA-binding transcriptional LysR family regulator